MSEDMHLIMNNCRADYKSRAPLGNTIAATALARSLLAVYGAGVQVVADLNNCQFRGRSTAENVYGVHIVSGVGTTELNLMNCDIEIEAPNDTAACVKCDDADGTINVRHSRTKATGSTAYDLDETAGNIYYDNHTSLVTGVNNGTPTNQNT